MFDSKKKPRQDYSKCFSIGSVIDDPASFYGRRDEITRILDRVRKGESTSVVGERRIGKTSLLMHLLQTGNKRLASNEHQFHFLSLQDAQFQDERHFLQYVLKKIGLKSDLNPEAKIIDCLIDFSELVEKYPKRLVLLADEFDNGLKQDRFSDQFFEHFRSMMSSRQIIFITASKKPLKAATLAGGYASPFWNVFLAVPLGAWTEGEAQEYLAAMHHELKFSEDELGLLAFFADSEDNRKPLKMQIALKTLVELRTENLHIERLYESFNERFTAEASSFYVDLKDKITAAPGKYGAKATQWIRDVLDIAKKVKDLK